MRRSTVIRRVRKLALALVACVAFAVVAPMYFAERRTDDSFAISAVSAAPRDLHMLTAPVRLSTAPDLILEQAVIYDYGPGAPDGTMSQVVLDGPVFTLHAAGRRPAASGSEAKADRAASAGVPEAPADLHAEAGQGFMSPVLEEIAALAVDLITIRRGTLHVTMLDGSVETIKDIQAEVKKTRDGRIASLGSFTVRGHRLAFDTTLSRPADKKLPSRWPLQVSFKSSLLQGSFNGHADLGDDLQLSGHTELSIASLRGVGGWFGLPLYQTEGFNETTVKGELTWARRSLAFEKAHIAVDGNQGNGRVVLNLASARPTLEATLDFATLNLTPYVDAARTQTFMFELPRPWLSSFDISLPMIRYLDADLRISAHEVKLKQFTLGQGAATITAQAGKLHADITELELPSGTLSAQVTAIMSEAPPRYALRAKIENLEVGAASGLLLRSSALSGRASVALDLTSIGYSLADVAKRLSGKAALTLPEGGRMAIDLKAVRAVAEKGTSHRTQLPLSQTDLDRLEGRALIIDGVAFAEDIQGRAGNLALALVGRLGLVDGNMDMRLMLKANHPPDQPLRFTDEPDEMVTLRGSWVKPKGRGREAGPLSRQGQGQ